jgi:hypothetical protein
MRLIFILLLLRGGWSREGWSSVDDVACGLVASTWYNVACRLTCGFYSCIYFLLTTRSSCGVSIFKLYVLLIHLTGLRGYVGRDHENLSLSLGY